MLYLFPEENVGRRRFLRRHRIVASIFELLHGLIELFVGDGGFRASLGRSWVTAFAASSFDLDPSFKVVFILFFLIAHLQVEVHLLF